MLPFVVSALAVALLAALVGRSVDQLGDRFGAGATGVLQSALGNLPELFVGLFALRAGLRVVVQAAIVGSILGNLLLVLGAAFVVGGLRHGELRFDGNRARTIGALMLLSVAALLVPSLAHYVHTPAGRHEGPLSVIVSVVLLVVFALSIPASLRRTGAAARGRSGRGTGQGTGDAGRSADDAGRSAEDAGRSAEHAGRSAEDAAQSGADSEQSAGDAGRSTGADPPRWPVSAAVVGLAVASVLAAFVSDWFVHALTPAITTLHISQAFAGLVIVAIAGNAVENVVGIQLAARNQGDYALSLILNSPLQIALVLAPALVLLSYVIGGVTLTLVFPPLLVTTMATSVVVVGFIIYDGQAMWLEGAALIGLYVVVAAAFWWG